MSYSGIAKIQHYVPQFLLKNFGIGKKHKVYVFDKQKGKTFETNVKNIAAESGFYDFEFENEKYTFEPSLSQIESKANHIIKSILREDSIGFLTPMDRAYISVFLSIQLVRTKWFRQTVMELPKLLKEHLNKYEGPDADLSAIEDYLKIPNKNESTMMNIQMIRSAPNLYAMHFADKLWTLAATDASHPFIIGDHPIGLHNENNTFPYGNLGLAVKGIEIYFPLSSKRLLAMWCSSFEENLLKIKTSNTPEGLHARYLLDSIKLGTPCLYSSENVKYVNSTQIRYAERFLFSSKNEFSLADQMISNNEKYKTGIRFTNA